jgi:hypothetical protein
VKLTANTSNTVIATLAEKTTIVNVRYLFCAKGKDENISKYCLVTDIAPSVSKERYNQFTITLKPSPVPTNGEIYLTESNYDYSFYELTQAQAAAINFNSVDVSQYGLVETMRLQVVDNTNNTSTEYVLTENDRAYEG